MDPATGAPDGPGSSAPPEVQQACGGVFRLRDLPMVPRKGVYRGVHWAHFEATVQLRVPLRGAEWTGVGPEAFRVKVSEREVIAKCTGFYVMEELNLRFRQEVDPDSCWFTLERDTGDDAGRSKVLLIEVAKRLPGEPWDRKLLSTVSPPRSPGELQMLFEVDQKGWKALPHRHWRDQDDRYITSRDRLCREFESGQNEESVQIRFLLHGTEWAQALTQAPRQKLWGLDISRRHVRLFIRGDRTKPLLWGRLAGNCVPDRCYFELLVIEVRDGGRTEDVPCLDLMIVKADDSYFDWGKKPIDYSVREDLLDEQLGDKGDSGKLDLAGHSPTAWIEEMRERAARAFNSGEYNDAIEYYTRLLQCTPGSEKLLSNRSAAYLKAAKFQLSLDDALKAQEICPGFAKVYFRKGQALQGLHRLREAIAAFREGMAIDGADNPEWNREIVKTKHMQREARERRGSWV